MSTTYDLDRRWREHRERELRERAERLSLPNKTPKAAAPAPTSRRARSTPSLRPPAVRKFVRLSLFENFKRVAKPQPTEQERQQMEQQARTRRTVEGIRRVQARR